MDRRRVDADQDLPVADLRACRSSSTSRTSADPYLSWMIAFIRCPRFALLDVYVVQRTMYTTMYRCTPVNPDVYVVREPSQEGR